MLHPFLGEGSPEGKKRGDSWDYAFVRIRSTTPGFLLAISSPIKRDFEIVG